MWEKIKTVINNSLYVDFVGGKVSSRVLLLPPAPLPDNRAFFVLNEAAALPEMVRKKEFSLTWGVTDAIFTAHNRTRPFRFAREQTSSLCEHALKLYQTDTKP